MAYGNKRILIGNGTTGGGGNVVIGGVVGLPNCPLGGFVVGSKLTFAANSAGKYRVHLFKAAPTVPGDGAAFTLTFSEDADYLGYFDFEDAAAYGSMSTAQNYSTLRHPVETVLGNLYAVVEGLTGASAGAGAFNLTLVVETD